MAPDDVIPSTHYQEPILFEGNNMINEYKELMQYEPMVGSSKLEQLEIVRKASANSRFAIGLKYFTFNEFIEAIKNGHSIKRIGRYNDELVSTRFVVIDIDDEEAKVEYDEIMQLADENTVIMNSTSGNPYKWHIYILSDRLLNCTEDLLTVTANFIGKLEMITKRHVEFDKALTSNWMAWCYGVPQDETHREDLNETLCWSKLVTKKHNYVIKEVNPESDEIKGKFDYLDLVPFNNRMLAKKLGKGMLDKDRNFSIYPPYLYANKPKFKDGHRHNVAMRWVLHLIPMYFKCVKKYNMDYQYEDLLRTFKWLCSVSFEAGYDLTDTESFMKSLYKEYKDKDYSYIEANFDGRVTTYKSLSFIRDMALKVRRTLRYDLVSNTYIATDKEELLEACKECHISFSTIRRRIIESGAKLKFECTMKRGRKNNFNDYIDSCLKATLPDGSTIIQIDRKHAMNRHFIKFCKSNEISYTTKCLPLNFN